MTPAPKGEPVDQLEEMTQNLQTYFFVHETFTDQKHGLVPAKACCEFPTKKCPPETTPNGFESTSKKAIIEAVGDLDCDGKTVTYRRELLDPPGGSD